MIGTKLHISGMIMEVIGDEGDKWKIRNHTTNDTLFMDKTLLEKSIKLGKAELLVDEPDQGSTK